MCPCRPVRASLLILSPPRIGALLLGIITDRFGALEAGFWFTSIAMLLSGIWVALAMDETLARINPMPGNEKAPAFAQYATLESGAGQTMELGDRIEALPQ